MGNKKYFGFDREDLKDIFKMAVAGFLAFGVCAAMVPDDFNLAMTAGEQLRLIFASGAGGALLLGGLRSWGIWDCKSREKQLSFDF